MDKKSIATLTIHGAPTMKKKEWNRLIKWVEDQAASLKYNLPTEFSKRYTAKLF